MNIARVRETMETIKGHQETFYMGYWCSANFMNGWARIPVTFKMNCGTTLCFAGFAVWLFGEESYLNIRSEAARVLDVSEEEASKLFYAKEDITVSEMEIVIEEVIRDYENREMDTTIRRIEF